MARLYKAGLALLLFLGLQLQTWGGQPLGSNSTTGVCIMNRVDLERGYGNFLMEVLVACVFLFHFTNLDFKRSLLAS